MNVRSPTLMKKGSTSLSLSDTIETNDQGPETGREEIPKKDIDVIHQREKNRLVALNVIEEMIAVTVVETAVIVITEAKIGINHREETMIGIETAVTVEETTTTGVRDVENK